MASIVVTHGASIIGHYRQVASIVVTHGASITGHYRQVAAVSRSFCTGLVLLDQD